MKNVQLLMMGEEAVTADKILVTITPTVSFTVGFNLTFTGNIDIDFKDGGGKEALTSGVEKTHLYAVADTYIVEITGDLVNITKFIADNSRITFISGLKTGLLNSFNITNNLYVGVLDMSNAPVSALLDFGQNAGLTNVLFATSGNSMVTRLFIDSCDLNSTLDLSNVPMSGDIRLQANVSAFDVLFATSGNGLITNFNMIFSGYVGILDFTNIALSGAFTCGSSVGVTNILFKATGNGALTIFSANGTQIGNLDFTVFPTSDGVAMNFISCSFTATEHDNYYIDLDNTGWINGTLTILAGNTARTAASDAAHANLLVNGWTLT